MPPRLPLRIDDSRLMCHYAYLSLPAAADACRHDALYAPLLRFRFRASAVLSATPDYAAI